MAAHPRNSSTIRMIRRIVPSSAANARASIIEAATTEQDQQNQDRYN